MFQLPGSATMAGTQALFEALFFIVLGWLIVSLLTRRFELHPIVEWGLSVAGLGVFVLLLEGAHVITGGRVLSNPWLVRGITVAVLVPVAVAKVVDARRRRGRWEGSRAWVVMVVLAAGGILLWGVSVWRSYPIAFGGDTSMHSAWASEILNGETTPSASITGDIPNFYPWLFHATLAYVAAMFNVHALNALGALQITLVIGTVLGLFALGQVTTGSIPAAAGAALLGALTGGFAYFLVHHPALVYIPRGHEVKRLGDLLFVRSYNPSFYQLAPPFPRDIAFVFLVCSMTLLVVAVKKRSLLAIAAAGVVLGLAGLSNAESFFVGVAVAGLYTFIQSELPRGRAFLTAMVSTLAVYALWLIPQILSYLQLGGYVNLTKVGPVDLPAWAILFGWGMVTPLAAVGFLTWRRRLWESPGTKMIVIFALTAGFFISASTLAPRLLGPAFLAIGRSHRYWPLFGFGLALLGSLGIAWLTERVRAGWPRAAVWVLLVLLCVPSPLLASVRLGQLFEQGYVANAARGEPKALLNLIGREPGRCVAAVPQGIAHDVWAYTGFRLVMYKTGVPHPGNQARVRWANIYQNVVPEDERLRDNKALTHGTVSRTKWMALAKKYGVDIVVAPKKAEGARGFPPDGIRAGRHPYTVYRLDDCGL